MNEKTRILAKTKNIQIIIDNCLLQKTEFTAIPRNSNSDDWEVELNIKSISKALEWGMFIKANRLELATNELFVNPVTTPVVQPRPKPKRKEKPVDFSEITEEQSDENENESTSLKMEIPSNNLLSFE
ncbi:MAG: hypothetical protein HY951_12565 [Bacteroidia bacterium]|nr:hypothetical protein [Bacteroidia bacterium]